MPRLQLRHQRERPDGPGFAGAPAIPDRLREQRPDHHAVTSRWALPRMVVSAAAVVALLPASGRAAPRPSWRVTRSDVRVVCPLTLGGSFEARTASLRGTLLLDTSRPIALKIGRAHV